MSFGPEPSLARRILCGESVQPSPRVSPANLGSSANACVRGLSSSAETAAAISNRNGRVVIQSTRLAVQRLARGPLNLTQQQWDEQAKRNRAEMGYFMHALGDALERGAINRETPDEDDSSTAG